MRNDFVIVLQVAYLSQTYLLGCIDVLDNHTITGFAVSFVVNDLQINNQAWF